MFRTSPVSSRRNAPLRQAARRAAAVLIEPVERRTLMSAGAVDPTFGTQGHVQFGGTGLLSSYSIVAADGSGRVLVGYTSGGEKELDASITRLTSAGSVDPTFGTNGVIAISGANDPGYEPEGGEFLYQVASLSNGNLLATVSGGIVEFDQGKSGHHLRCWGRDRRRRAICGPG